MNRYTLRGRVRTIQAQKNERDNYEARLRVEAHDEDVQYDDLIGTAFTNTRGFFEITFTDDDFRQDPGETEPAPDLYFRVFRGEELLGRTPTDADFSLVPFTQPFEQPRFFGNLALPNQDPIYRVELFELRAVPLLSESDRPPATPPAEQPVQIVDVLPSLDQIHRTGRMASVSAPASSGGDLQSIVESALGNILGHTQRTDNPKTLVATLTQTFTPRQVDGRTVYDWNPQSVSVRASDLGGGITGAQASLYHRAKTAIQDGIQLLNGLTPLKPSADRENMEATRSIIRTEMQELLAELGARGGPRILRVDNLFQLLLGDDLDSGNQRPDGQLKKLAEYFGLVRGQINTVEEEQNYSNFLTLKDYLQSLRRSWVDYKRTQDSSAGAYIGTQLVRLSQALAVVAESVQEVYRIMELFFLGPEERLSVYIDFTRAAGLESGGFPLPDGTAYLDTAQLRDSMSVEGLLNWVWRFATEEGPLLAKSGGKLGIQVVSETSDRLMVLTQATTYTPIPNAAFRREGVIRAMRDLAYQLYQVRQLAEQVKLPSGDKPDDLDFPPARFTSG
ncbi:hypothetical protein J5X98_26020 [Leptothermofonsia sichuanensis E412]|uniref:hypothetical protein n=1 Tax=Leptothermofonsia sichuanensis TaxID=2917832 RepID=UPI001CA77FBC|nr:hypothetical protein [Leptothermofonsia sichuanensis]QZZ20644.1 hypothetical protein J5X98_26020 [Leptothermofonsia sichuanensis E412]